MQDIQHIVVKVSFIYIYVCSLCKNSLLWK